jgi:hypothetical protein
MGAALVGTSIASSAGALAHDLPILAAARIPAAALVVVWLALGVAIRRRARAASPTVRARAVLVVACAYFAAAIVAGGAVTGHPVEPRYLAPIVPAAAILLGGLAVGPLATLRRAVAGNAAVMIGVAVIVTAGRRTPPPDTWTVLDAEALAPTLSARGLTFSDLYRHLHGPETHRLLAAMGPFLPPPAGAASRAPSGDDLLLFKAARARVQEAGAERWILRDLPDGAVAMGRAAPSWIDTGTLAVCAGARCAQVDVAAADPDRGAMGTVVQRAHSGPGDVGPPALTEGPTPDAVVHWTVVVRVRPPPDGPAHVITLADRLAPPWRIERVEGLRCPEQLPSSQVTVMSGTGEGRIVFAVDLPTERTAGFRPWLLPSLAETGEEEGALRALWRW